MANFVSAEDMRRIAQYIRSIMGSEGANLATFVVDSDAKLSEWAANKSGNDYTSVYIAQGKYTLPSGGINLTAAGTVTVEGNPNSLLLFESLTNTNGNYAAALYYTERPTELKYSIKSVQIECVGAPAQEQNIYPVGFYNCNNLDKCSAYSRATGTKAWQAAYAFYNCENLSFCFGASSGANNGNAYTYASSNHLSNCVADESAYPALYDSQADIIAYASSNYLINCVAKVKNGYEITRAYFGCNYLVGCKAEVTQDASSTVNEVTGFARCSRLTGCNATIDDRSGKTLTERGGFVHSAKVVNCVSQGARIYDCAYVAYCEATGFDNSYADEYKTAAADNVAGGYNRNGVLVWNTNKWA